MYNVTIVLIPRRKFSKVKGQGIEQHLRSCVLLQGTSAWQMFVVTQASTQTFQFPACTNQSVVRVVCVSRVSCVCYSIHACPLHPFSPPPAPLHDLPDSTFTLTAALALWGNVTTGQLQAEIRSRVYFPPKHFPVKRKLRNQRRDRQDCQIEPCGAHCYPADEQVLIGTCKGQSTADRSQWITEAIVWLHPLLLPLKLPVFSLTEAKFDPGMYSSLSTSFIDTEIIQYSWDLLF